jgi:hypothetical protein
MKTFNKSTLMSLLCTSITPATPLASIGSSKSVFCPGHTLKTTKSKITS